MKVQEYADKYSLTPNAVYALLQAGMISGRKERVGTRDTWNIDDNPPTFEAPGDFVEPSTRTNYTQTEQGKPIVIVLQDRNPSHIGGGDNRILEKLIEVAGPALVAKLLAPPPPPPNPIEMLSGILSLKDELFPETPPPEKDDSISELMQLIGGFLGGMYNNGSNRNMDSEEDAGGYYENNREGDLSNPWQQRGVSGREEISEEAAPEVEK